MGPEEAIRRANASLAAGADIAFVEAPQTMAELEAVPRDVKGPCLFNYVEGGKTPEIDLDQARAFGFKLAILPGILLRSVIEVCEGILTKIHDDNELPDCAQRNSRPRCLRALRRRRLGRIARSIRRSRLVRSRRVTREGNHDGRLCVVRRKPWPLCSRNGRRPEHRSCHCADIGTRRLQCRCQRSLQARCLRGGRRRGSGNGAKGDRRDG